jgi:hypothetical protein
VQSTLESGNSKCTAATLYYQYFNVLPPGICGARAFAHYITNEHYLEAAKSAELQPAALRLINRAGAPLAPASSKNYILTRAALYECFHTSGRSGSKIVFKLY